MWTLASDVQILHGRRICRPKPLCDQCSVRDDCDYFRAASLRASTRGRPRPASRSRRARKTAGTMRPMTRDAFERLVAEAITLIPRRFRREMQNIAIVVEDEPARETARGDGDRAARLALRALPGHAAARTHVGHGNGLPDRITIFQRPIEEDCEDEDDVRAVIGETLIHEVGHYFGLSEEEIEEIEERYWRGETLGPDEDDELTRSARAAKRFGQHFLEPAWVAKLIASIAPAPDDTFLEIGPGRGALTVRWRRACGRSWPSKSIATWRRALRAHAAPNVARHRRRLPRRRSRGRCLAGRAQPVRVVGNLPYNVVVADPVQAAARCGRRAAALPTRR